MGVTNAVNDLLIHANRSGTSPVVSPRSSAPNANGTANGNANGSSDAAANGGRWQDESLDNLLSQLNDVSASAAPGSGAPISPRSAAVTPTPTTVTKNEDQ